MAERENRPATQQAPAVWDPFRELERWSPFGALAGGGSPFEQLARVFSEGPASSGMIRPAVDVAENDDRYVVTVEVPGAKRDDIVVEVHEDVLSIRGEKKSERQEQDERRRWSERVYGAFVRSFRLPPDADGDRISASFENGVLTLEIPKKEEAKPKVIAVK